MQSIPFDRDRRFFLTVSAAASAGLVLACRWNDSRADAGVQSPARTSDGQILEPNARLTVAPDNTVTVRIHHSEMGQAIMTGLAMIVAEELDADWKTVRAEMALAKPVYVNPAFGVQATGGSTSVKTSWQVLRRAGAVARCLLITTAAGEWGVPVAECWASTGTVTHAPSKRTVRYGELVHKAAKLPVPSDVQLKKPEDFTLIGTTPPKLDTQAKITGKAVYGIDVRVPDLVIATVIRPPVFGGRLKKFDPSTVNSQPGVRRVLAIDSGVAIAADTFRQAERAAETLDVTWDEGNKAGLSSEQIRAHWRKLLNTKEATEVQHDGYLPDALRAASQRLEAEYELPFQAHACPEPMNCTVDIKPGRCDVWVPTQNQGGVQDVVAGLTGLDLDAVHVHTTFLGGGFGRRGDVDFVIDAVQVAQAMKKPVQVIWTREQDMLHDHFRPASLHRLRAGLDAEGMPVALDHLFVCPSYMDSTLEAMAPAGMPRWLPRFAKNALAVVAVPVIKYFTSGEAASSGATDLGYSIPHMRVRHIKDDPGIPVGAWRSVANSRHAFAVESFLDEIALAGGQDPVELRDKLLADQPRHQAVLRLAAGRAGWGEPLAEGRSRGMAFHEFHGTPAAMIAEVSVSDKGLVTVHRVVAAVDCGTVINPRDIEAQISGGVAFGLTATVRSSVTIQDGKAQQSNFDGFPLLTLDEMPRVEVYTVPSGEPPIGIGEVGVPPIAPAVANAICAATGKRMRRLPIHARDLVDG